MTCRWTGSNTCTQSSFAQEMKARPGEPAKTTSAGPDRVSNVAVTRRFVTSTMLIEDEMWFTTQSSFVVRNRTETGSTPTGTASNARGMPKETSNNSMRPSGTLQTARVRPSELNATGWTGAVSKFTKEAAQKDAGRENRKTIPAY